MHKLTSAFRFILFSSVLLAITSLCANNFLGIPNAKPYVGISLGTMAIKNSGTTQRQTLTPPLPADTFVTSNRKSNLTYSLVAGMDIPLFKSKGAWLTGYQLQTSLWQLSNKVQGIHSMPFFPSQPYKYNYNYTLQLTGLSLDAAVDLYRINKFIVNAGLGLDLADSTTKNYTESPLNNAPATAVSFSDKKTTLFFYHVRFSLQYTINRHWRSALSYQYYPAIKTQTGVGTDGGDSVSSLATHTNLAQLAFSLHYIF
jgi:hypothetical protein